MFLINIRVESIQDIPAVRAHIFDLLSEGLASCDGSYTGSDTDTAYKFVLF